jgi:hypothetical protein
VVWVWTRGCYEDVDIVSNNEGVVELAVEERNKWLYRDGC